MMGGCLPGVWALETDIISTQCMRSLPKDIGSSKKSSLSLTGRDRKFNSGVSLSASRAYSLLVQGTLV